MTELRLCAVGLIVAVTATLLRDMGFRADRIFALCGAVGIIAATTGGIGSVLGSLTSALPEATAEDTRAIFKVVGVGYAFGICSDVCQELGEKSTASALNVAARVEILVIALPYIEKIFHLGKTLLGG